MERIKTLLARYSQTAFLFFIGLILIVYLAMGVLYWQQAPQQREFEGQIVKLRVILSNPLPNREALQAEYDNINRTLTPIADNVSITMLLSLAKESGIDISAESGKFQVPIASHSSDPSSYQLLSFKGIRVQGEPDKVMAFIRALDSDTLLKTQASSAARIVVRAVTRVAIEEVEVAATGQEGERKAEFRSIIEAVKVMMNDNTLSRLPNPMSFDLGRASNRMGDDPLTPVFDGFPDVTTSVSGKGYTGNATPKKGYLLYEHDKISSDNTTRYSTANYTQALTTTYYYTAEADATIRQWSSPNVAIAREYPDSRPTKMELKASLDIDFYFKP